MLQILNYAAFGCSVILAVAGLIEFISGKFLLKHRETEGCTIESIHKYARIIGLCYFVFATIGSILYGLSIFTNILGNDTPHSYYYLPTVIGMTSPAILKDKILIKK